MYLARGVLNPASRNVQRDLADVGQLHRTVMAAFRDEVDDAPRKTLGVLYRIDEDLKRGQLVLFVQSRERPDFASLPAGYFLDVRHDLDLALANGGENPSVRDVGAERGRIAAGERFVFRLQANTTKKILTKTQPDGTKSNGKRVPVRGEVERRRWLDNRAAQGGFLVHALRESEVRSFRNGKPQFAGAVFEGLLEVRDPERFREALEGGIGPGKAFGFGLLSIQRAQ